MPASSRHRHRHRRRRRGDCGAASVEFALAAPLLMTILLTLTQAASWGLGYLAAQAAADHALQTARVVGGSEQAGQTDGEAMLRQVGGRLVSGATVTVTRGEQTTTVHIHGTARGLPVPIDLTVQAPTERYTTP